MALATRMCVFVCVLCFGAWTSVPPPEPRSTWSLVHFPAHLTHTHTHTHPWSYAHKQWLSGPKKWRVRGSKSLISVDIGHMPFWWGADVLTGCFSLGFRGNTWSALIPWMDLQTLTAWPPLEPFLRSTERWVDKLASFQIVPRQTAEPGGLSFPLLTRHNTTGISRNIATPCQGCVVPWPWTDIMVVGVCAEGDSSSNGGQEPERDTESGKREPSKT